ncbi:hypothetical protein TcCL_Unassigned03368, partial [Trypanosoma cruzi]
KESSIIQIYSVTSSCSASGPRRSASISEWKSVAKGTRVGNWDAAARRGTGKCPRPCSVTGHSARQVRARLPAAARCTSTGRSFVVVESYNSAADPDARTARDNEPSIANTVSSD